MSNDLIGAREVARILGVSRPTVTRMAQRGTLPAVRIGNANAFEREVVMRLALDRTDLEKTGA